ncbi:hypothetical protein AKA01nite_03400 [Alkalibacterium kapii]|uniref:Uncharacterized protein n=1 Tax=Alkalibacterium kapii TaxID=426704 RepID=A0A511ARA8_9LACT|nr:hypothetical protein AKA01nite_03400 [Alkalibacterium kapii]
MDTEEVKFKIKKNNPFTLPSVTIIYVSHLDFVAFIIYRNNEYQRIAIHKCSRVIQWSVINV